MRNNPVQTITGANRGQKYQPQPPQPAEEPEESEATRAIGEAGEEGGQEEIGMTLVKWAGFLLVAGALAVLPFAIWVSTTWGFVSGAAGLAGCALLGVAFAGRPGA